MNEKYEELQKRYQELKERIKYYQEHNFVNATPDGNYALRILLSYRQMCNVSVSDAIGCEPTNPLCIEMNKTNEKRKLELDKAIDRLSEAT